MSKAYIEQAKREKEEEERRRAASQKTKDWYDRNGPRYQRSVEESFARNRAYGEAQREKKRQLSSVAPTLGGQQKQLRRELSGSLVKAPNPLVTQFGIRRYDEQQKHEQEKGDYIQRVYDSAGMRESERVAGDDSPYLPKAYSNDERRRALSAKGRELDTDYQYLLDVQKTRAMRRAVPGDNPYKDLSSDEISERMGAYRREKRLLEEERARLDADTARVQEEIKSEEYEKRYGYLLKEADFAQYGGYPSKRYPEMSEENSPSAALGAAYAEEYGLSPVSKEERRALSGGAVTENRDFYAGLSEEDRAMYRLISHEIGSDEATGYALMDEEERGIFRYLYNRDGADAAREYYENLSEELTKRQGQREKSAVEAIENPLVRKTQELAGAYGAGLSDFGTAVHQTFSRSDAVPLGAVQYQAEATAAEKTGFDRVLYDATRAVGGMTPALAAGAIAGAAGLPAGAAKWIGQSVMGLNAYGNSYRSALESGHGEGEATAYALLSAASEVATEKALSGISALGGALPDTVKAKLGQNMGSAALRFALDMGVSMGSEGFEEVLQNEIDLMLRNAVLGEQNDLNPFTEENLYTFLSSALSAGALELPGAAFQTRRVTPGADAGAAIDRSYDAIARTGLWSPTSTGSMAEAAGMARAQVAQYNENAANASARRLAKAGDVSFRPLPVFKNGKVVEPDQPALPKGVRIVENETVESGSGTMHDVPKGAVGALPNGVKAYTPEQAQQKNKVRDTYMSFVISGKQGLKDFWNRITGRDNNGAKKETAYLGLVTPEMGKVYEQVIGQDLTNYSYSVDSDLILHVNDEHGVESYKKTAGEKAIDGDAFSGLLDLIKNPDAIYQSHDEMGHPAFVTLKYDDGTTAYVQWVQENNKGVKRLRGKTFYATSDYVVPVWEDGDHKKIVMTKLDAKKRSSPTANNAQEPLANVQNVAGPASLDTNIPQSETGVNTQSMQGAGEISANASDGAARGKALYPIFDKDGKVINGYGETVDTANRGGYSDTEGGGRNGQGLGNRSAAGRSDTGYLYQESGGGRGAEAESHTRGGAGVSGVPEKNTGNLGQIQNTGEAREVRISYPDCEVGYHSPALPDTAETTRVLAQRFTERGLNAEIFDGDMVELRNGQRIVHHGRAMTLADGTVVLRNGTENADEVLQHELIHHGARTGAPEAARVIAAVRESGLNVNDKLGWDNLQILTKRYERNGKRLADLENEGRLFEELSATVAGFHRRDPDVTRRAFGALFNDYDGIISAIEEAYPELNTRGSGETPAAFSSARNAESGANGDYLKSGQITKEAMDRFIRDRNKVDGLQRQYDKVLRKTALREEEMALVNEIIRGTKTEKSIESWMDRDGILRVARARAALKAAKAPFEDFRRRQRQEKEKLAEKHTEHSDNWHDKKLGISYEINTMERNFLSVAGKEDGERLIREYIDPIHKNEAESIRFANRMRKRVADLNLSKKESYWVQRVGEGDMALSDVPGSSREKVKHAVSEFRAIYDELLDMANRVLIENGYPPIPKRENYFPHFNDETDPIHKALSAMGISFQTSMLPTDIAGLTYTFKPGKKYFANFNRRNGKATTFDAVTGFDRYIEGIRDVIYHTEDIQKLRALDRVLRKKYNEESVQKKVDEIKLDRTLTEEQRREELNKALYGEDGKQKTRSLSNFVQNLTEYTNLLAGKKAYADREMERRFGRIVYDISAAAERNVAANMTGFNVASALTNFIPLTQAASAVKNKNLLRGMWESVHAIRADDGFRDRSTFLTNRRGTKPLTQSALREAGGFLMEFFDSLTSQSIVRAKYYDLLEKGYDAETALERADKFAAGVIGDRSKGAMPTMFYSKNPLAKAFTMFQLEVNNQYGYLFKDLPKEIRADHEKWLGALLWGLFKYFVGAYLFNDLYEAAVGRRPALDLFGTINSVVGDASGWKVANVVDIGGKLISGQGFQPLEQTEKKDIPEVVTGGLGDVAENLPFIGGVLGGGRIPISSAIPDIPKVWETLDDKDTASNKKLDVFLRKGVKPVMYLLPTFGMGQVAKSAEGLATVNAGGGFGLDKKGRRKLQFPVEQTAGNYIKAGLFGKYALPGAQEYVDSGFKTMSASKTEKALRLRETGVPLSKFLEIDKELSDEEKYKDDIGKDGFKIEKSGSIKKRKYIDSLGFDTKQRKILYDAMGVAKEVAQAPHIAVAGLSSAAQEDATIANMQGRVGYKKFAEVYQGWTAIADRAEKEKWEDGEENKKKRQYLYDDQGLTAKQKALIDNLLINDEKEVSYESEGAFRLSQRGKTDFAKGEALSAVSGLDPNLYADYLEGIKGKRKHAEKYAVIDSLPLKPNQRELLKALVSTSKASKSTVRYYIEMAPITRAQKDEFLELFLG